jgi:hypothetical protein
MELFLGTRLLLAPPQVFAQGLGEPLFSGCTFAALTRRERGIFIHSSMLSEGHHYSRAALRVYQTPADGGPEPAYLANIRVVVYLLPIPAGLGPNRALP